jgi:hypothetical protein
MDRYAITFGKDDSITVPAATPSLEMALEIAYLVASQLARERPDLAGSEVHVWRQKSIEGDPAEPLRGELVASFVQGAPRGTA